MVLKPLQALRLNGSPGVVIGQTLKILPCWAAYNKFKVFFMVKFLLFLYLAGQNGFNDLRLGAIGQKSILIAASSTAYGCMDYDFIK